MKIGDKVRVIGIPDTLPSGMETKQLFKLCLGRVFPIEGFLNGQVELCVGEVVGELDYMHSIWIEPEFVEVVETSN